VTIGGIYALERIAGDSVIYQPTVMEVLSACIREHSSKPWPEQESGGTAAERSTRPDIQAALTVIGRRNLGRDDRPIDLTGVNLTRARIVGNLVRAGLTGATLTGADLAGATLTGASLGGANLTGAILGGVKWPEDAQVPEGWKLDAEAGRLQRADADSGAATTK
jgi:hypothetical protein